MGLIDKVREMAAKKGFYNDQGSSYRNLNEYDDYNEELESENFEEEEEETYQPNRKLERVEAKSPVEKAFSRLDTTRQKSQRLSNSQVVNINTSVQMQVVISYPESIEEAAAICDFVKSHKTVIINLENVKHESAQRIIDFLCGVSYALNGDIQYVSNKIFILAPESVDISGTFKEELRAKGLLFSF